MRRYIFILLAVIISNCNNAKLPNNFKKIGTIKFVDGTDKTILIDYKYHISNHNLKIGDEVYLFHQSKKITLVVKSIKTWIKCALKDDRYDLQKITEDMDVYIEFKDESNHKTYSGNLVYQDINNSSLNEKERIQKIIKNNKIYFKNMKDKIYDNWYPPVFENDSINLYHPGKKLKLMPSDKVDAFIILNENGDVLDAKIIKSNGFKALDDSCIDAIKNSKNFGKLPDEFKYKIIGIPFIFTYKSK